MKLMTFDYHKTNTDTSSREFIAFNTPTHNYFGLDISELEDFEVSELVKFLGNSQLSIEKLVKERTEWLKTKGFGTYYRNFSEEKMHDVVTEELN